MTVTLCIETSGAHCSLALAVDEHIYTQERMLHRAHNEHLLAMLDALFDEVGIVPARVELVAFGCGPGSFTGVRISAAVTQAVAFAAGARVLPVASSRVLALSAARMLALQHGSETTWICALPSRGQAYYVSAYRCDADCGETALAEVHANELVEAAPAWFAQQTDIAIIGSKPPWLSAAMQGKFVADVFPSARAMVSMARQCHAEGGSETAERALPMYISGDSPWHKSTTGVVLPAS